MLNVHKNKWIYWLICVKAGITRYFCLLIDDVDTELVRKLASKTIAVPGSPEKGGKKVTAKQNGVASSLTDIR